MTIRDVAREADVSVATVSRLINKSGPVGESTRTRVQAVIDKYGYRPNALARSLYKKKTKIIGLIIPDTTNMFFAQLCLEVERAALHLGYSVFLCNTMNDMALESRYLDEMRDRRVDGIILAGGRVNQTITDTRLVGEMKKKFAHVPVVMVNGKMDGFRCGTVCSDEYRAIYQMLRYIADLGHTRVGLIGGISGVTSFDVKKEAFLRARAEYGLNSIDGWIIEGGYSLDSGMLTMETLLTNNTLPSAVIAINDLVAVGAIKQCEAHGVSIPEDISIVGFDDTPIARVVNPALTTVAHPYESLGKESVRIVDDLVNARKAENNILLETELVVRASCRRM